MISNKTLLLCLKVREKMSSNSLKITSPVKRKRNMNAKRSTNSEYLKVEPNIVSLESPVAAYVV